MYICGQFSAELCLVVCWVCSSYVELPEGVFSTDMSFWNWGVSVQLVSAGLLLVVKTLTVLCSKFLLGCLLGL
jgi:hypothetical protein